MAIELVFHLEKNNNMKILGKLTGKFNMNSEEFNLHEKKRVLIRTLFFCLNSSCYLTCKIFFCLSSYDRYNRIFCNILTHINEEYWG